MRNFNDYWGKLITYMSLCNRKVKIRIGHYKDIENPRVERLRGGGSDSSSENILIQEW